MTPAAVTHETYENRYTLPPIEQINDTAEEILAKQERVRKHHHCCLGRELHRLRADVFHGKS